MIARRFAVCVLLLVFAAVARGREYDAELDIGLVAGDATPRIAARNTERLNAALAAQWPGGRFKLASSARTAPPVPLLSPIRCAAKAFYFAGTIKTPVVVGGALYGGGGRGYMMFNEQPNLAGAFTTFIRIDSDKGGAVVLLRGAGFILDGISLHGRRWRGGNDYVGQKASCLIEVEGRAQPATGCHLIRNCVLAEGEVGIRTLAGYYEDGKFVALEGHADQGTVEGVVFSGVGSCFRSENQQALGWSFRDVHVDSAHSGGATVVFDIVRGGNVTASNVQLNHHLATLVRVVDCSHNTQRISIEDVRFDGGYAEGARLTLFEYAGLDFVPDATGRWVKFTLRVTGHIAGSETAPAYDASKLVVISPNATGVDRADLLFDIARLPGTARLPGKEPQFERVGDGPWWRPVVRTATAAAASRAP